MQTHSVPGSILDVGAGIGQFLHFASPYFEETIGTEVSDSAISIAKTRYGLQLLQGTIESLDIPAVDNITMFHVLEHVPSPKDTLARCYNLLKPGGRIFICVPNDINSWRSRVDAIRSRIHATSLSPMIGLPKCGTTAEIHLSHFTAKTLSFGVRNAGFAIVSLSNDPYYVASGWRLARHTIEYAIHESFRLPTYSCIWLVAERPANSAR
jgi:SAM-dependent methyltransferase